MLDVITRACRHPLDYSGVLKVRELQFKEKVSEGNGVYSFIFTADKLPEWQAGQHAIFSMPDKKVTGKTWRPFSVASAPHEGVIRIGTIIPPEPSSFKYHLSNLELGECIRMYGPFGELYVRPQTKNVVAVAGGIGITPFRSILADLAHKHRDVQLTLIYSAKESYTYQTELEEWTSKNKNLNIIYTHTPEEVAAELEKQTSLHKNTADYLLSGAPGMIIALRKQLDSLNINKARVLNDPFKGY